MEVSGHAANFLLFSKRTATGPSCGKSMHVPHLRALCGCSLVSSKLLKSRKSAVCPETPPPPPHVRKPPPFTLVPPSHASTILIFSMRICFFIISLVSVKLKSRLLTWHYLLRKHSVVIRPFSSEEGGVWVWDYVAVTGVAWSELVNNRCHFWMDRQELHYSTM